VKLIAAGGHQSIASTFSPIVDYPVDPSRDLLIVYNSNPGSTNSLFVKDYYLAHRPMANNANVLGVNCPIGDFIGTNDFHNQLDGGVISWRYANPTKHPEYVILLLDVPSRITDGSYPDFYGSVSFALRDHTPGIKPFITHINMGGTNDCRAYVDKLEFIGTNYSPGSLVLSASGSSYGNTMYLVDDSAGLAGESAVVTNAITGLLQYGALPGNIYAAFRGQPLITQATNVAGYISWGIYAGLGPDYATDGSIRFVGNSGWYIIETIESFNGLREVQFQGTFVKWYAANAFGGSGHSNTPVGAVSHTSEPSTGGVNNSAEYFGLWQSGRKFGAVAWISSRIPAFQAVGDPLVRK
jgi:hypothetical protein